MTTTTQELRERIMTHPSIVDLRIQKHIVDPMLRRDIETGTYRPGDVFLEARYHAIGLDGEPTFHTVVSSF